MDRFLTRFMWFACIVTHFTFSADVGRFPVSSVEREMGGRVIIKRREAVD